MRMSDCLGPYAIVVTRELMSFQTSSCEELCTGCFVEGFK